MKRTKKKESEEVTLDKLAPYLDRLDFDKPIFILAFDQSTTFTGFIGGIMDFNDPDFCEDMGDGEIVYVPQLFWLGDPEESHVFEITYAKYGAAMAPYPLALNRSKYFESLISGVVSDYQKHLLQDIPASFNDLWKNKCFIVESVFCSMPSNTVPLARYQTLAINVGLKEAFLPFEYVNTSAKKSVGAAGAKENVTLCVNQIFNTNIPDTEKCSHVTDAVALLYHHVQVLAKFHTRKK